MVHLSLALYSDRDRVFSANHGSFQRVLGGDVATSWLAVEINDVPYVLKLASEDLTRWVTGRAETSFGVNCPSKRERQQTKENVNQSKNREGRVEQSCFLWSLVLQPGAEIWIQCWGDTKEGSVNYVEGAFAKHALIFFLDVCLCCGTYPQSASLLFSPPYFPLQPVLQCWPSVSSGH